MRQISCLYHFYVSRLFTFHKQQKRLHKYHAYNTVYVDKYHASLFTSNKIMLINITLTLFAFRNQQKRLGTYHADCIVYVSTLLILRTSQTTKRFDKHHHAYYIVYVSTLSSTFAFHNQQMRSHKCVYHAYYVVYVSNFSSFFTFHKQQNKVYKYQGYFVYVSTLYIFRLSNATEDSRQHNCHAYYNVYVTTFSSTFAFQYSLYQIYQTWSSPYGAYCQSKCGRERLKGGTERRQVKEMW